MQLAIRLIWIALTAFNTFAIVYFVIGVTAGFHRSIFTQGPSGVLTAFIILPLVVLLTTFSIVKQVQCWHTGQFISWEAIICILIAVLLASMMPGAVNPRGWLYDFVSSSKLETSQDRRYEFQFEIVNGNQRNSSDRIFLRDISTGEEIYIALDVERDYFDGDLLFNGSTMMESSNDSGKYIARVIPSKHATWEQEVAFEIDISNRTSRRLTP